jgi:hypothetical protein
MFNQVIGQLIGLGGHAQKIFLKKTGSFTNIFPGGFAVVSDDQILDGFIN